MEGRRTAASIFKHRYEANINETYGSLSANPNGQFDNSIATKPGIAPRARYLNGRRSTSTSRLQDSMLSGKKTADAVVTLLLNGRASVPGSCAWPSNPQCSQARGSTDWAHPAPGAWGCRPSSGTSGFWTVPNECFTWANRASPFSVRQRCLQVGSVENGARIDGRHDLDGALCPDRRERAADHRNAGGNRSGYSERGDSWGYGDGDQCGDRHQPHGDGQCSWRIPH